MNHLKLRVIDIIKETATANTYIVEHLSAERINYKAGQFITLLLLIDGKEVRRSYSLSSTPGIDSFLSFTVQRKINGSVSRYIIDHLKVGDVLNALPPTGRFIAEEPYASTYCFFAAGSGITPIYSLIKELLQKSASQIILFYQNQNEELSIFRKALIQLNEAYEKFHLIELFSNPNNHSKFPVRLNNGLVERLVLEKVKDKDVVFYLCGPVSFMQMVQFTLRVMKFNDEQIKLERFVVETPPPPPFMQDLRPKEVKIYWDKQVYKFNTAWPDDILKVALQNNIALPYSCRGGRCSTCAVKLLKGKVKMSMNDVLTQKDLDDGLILTCVAYPETDVVLLVE